MAPHGSDLSSTGNTKQSRINASKHWFFTWNNYTEENILWLLNEVAPHKYVFQEEIGESGTPHLQGYVKLNKKGRPMETFKNKNIHWEKCRDWKSSVKYCSDEDKRHGRIWNNIRYPKKLKIITELFEWQQKVVDNINNDDDRHIHWYWDRDGNTGKSALVKYLCVHNDALICSGKASDMKYMIVKYEQTHGVYPELIIFDIPRSNLGYVNYTGIEEINNGCFASTKYECEMVIMNSPCILVFANEEPDYNAMSEDRWVVTKIAERDTGGDHTPKGEADAVASSPLGVLSLCKVSD